MGRLRIPEAVVSDIRERIARFDTPEVRAEWRKAGVSDDYYRHLLLMTAVGSHEVCDWYDRLGVNDDHIASMLRKIVPPLDAS